MKILTFLGFQRASQNFHTKSKHESFCMNLEDSDACKLAFEEKITEKFQKEIDISTLPEVRFLYFTVYGDR